MRPSEIKARRDKHFSEANKKEFKRLYLEENKSARELSKKFKIRSSTADAFAHTLVDTDCIRSLRNVHRKLDEEQVMEILKTRYCHNFSIKQLARDYNVSQSTISSIVTGATWKHVYRKFTPE